MSECVVRMERVPKNCDDGCWGRLSGECPWCDSIDGYKMVGNRPPNCPIIVVLPEGHGRLVDISPLDVIAFRDKDDSFYAGVLSVCERIDKLPTIVPAEAKRKVDAHDAVAPTDTPTDTPTVAAERSET